MYLQQIKISFISWAALTFLTGVIYPLAVTGIAKAVFPFHANGSVLLDKDGKAIGSSLIGQPFDDPKYFWSRLSATGPVAYNGAASSGSNLGPQNPALIKAVQYRVNALRKADPQNTSPIPIDLVTASGSGLDPHITPAAARYQAARIARERGIPEAGVTALIQAHTRSRLLGVIGEPVVNVLELNLALNQFGK